VACGCGKRIPIAGDPNHEQVQTMATGVQPSYTVTTPDGGSRTFDRYIDAVIYKRTSNGTLTTGG
jgi:hypothetical protein